MAPESPFSPVFKLQVADVWFGVLIILSAILLGVDVELSLQGIETFSDAIFWIQRPSRSQE